MGMGAEMMSKVLFAALVCSMLQAAVCSQAWSEFTTSKKAPTGSRRLMAAGLGNKNSVTVPVQPIKCGSKNCPDASAQKFLVTVNSFISEGKTLKTTTQEKIQERIYKLCSQGAPGTSFSHLAQTTWQGGASAPGKVADPMCYYCLSKGMVWMRARLGTIYLVVASVPVSMSQGTLSEATNRCRQGRTSSSVSAP